MTTKNITSIAPLLLLITTLVVCVPAQAQNLVENPGFETGLSPWVVWGDAALSQTDTEMHSGDYSAHISNRTETWQGPAQSLLGELASDTSYRVSAWVKVDGDSEQTVDLMFVQTDDRGDAYTAAASSLAFPDHWVQVSGVFAFKANDGPVTRLDFFIQGPDPGVDFFVDDVEILALPNDWKTASEQAIDQHRKRDVKITVVDSNDRPVRGATVQLMQTARGFPLGMAMAYNAFDTEPEYRQYILDRFNWAVHENEAKWYANEGARDVVTYERADEMLDFAEANGIQMRGHTLFWAPDQWQPSWVPDLSDEELALEVEERLEDAVDHFAGRFRHWDVNNEMLHGDFFERRLGSDIRQWMFDRTHEIDPDAVLFVNDYNIISGGEADRYVRQIQGFLDQGFPLGGIGAQGHFTNADYWSIQTRLDKLAQFGLPVWVTELDVLQADENVRADVLEMVMRSVYAHPAVEGIMLWGFWAGSHWRGANAALVDLDWTINAAGRRFDDLLAEWTSEESLVTGIGGVAPARVFHGDYDLEVGIAGFPTTQVTAQVGPAETELEIVVKLDFEVVEDFTINAGISGAWFNPDTAGQGQFIDVDAENQFMFLSWFTYTGADSENPFQQRWLTAQGNYSGDTAELTVYESLGGEFNAPQAVSTKPVGQVSVKFSDCESGSIAYAINDETLEGEFPVQRVIPGSEALCESLVGTSTQAVDINAGMDGAWFDPGTSGQGFLIDAHPDSTGGNFIFLSWFTYGDDTESGQRWLTAQGGFEGSMAEIDLFETTGGAFDSSQSTSTVKVGSMSLDFSDCSHAQLSYSLPDDEGDGEIALNRLLPGTQAICENL